MYIMALNKDVIERLLSKLDYLQKEIETIHGELLVELDLDKHETELSAIEQKEIETIRKENDYRTLDEWNKSKE